MKYYAVVEYQAPGSMEPAEIQRAFFNNNRIRAVTSLDDANSMAQSVEDKAHLIFEIAFTNTNTISELKLLDGVTGARPFKSNDKEIKDAIYIKPAKASNDFILTKAMIKDAEIDLLKVETQRIAAAEEAAKKAEADKIAAEEALKKAAADKATEEAARKVEADKAAEEADKAAEEADKAAEEADKAAEEADKAAEEAAKKAAADKVAADAAAKKAAADKTAADEVAKKAEADKAAADEAAKKAAVDKTAADAAAKKAAADKAAADEVAKKAEADKAAADEVAKKAEADKAAADAAAKKAEAGNKDKKKGVVNIKLVAAFATFALTSLAVALGGFAPVIADLLLKAGVVLPITSAAMIGISMAVGLGVTLSLALVYYTGLKLKEAYINYKLNPKERYEADFNACNQSQTLRDAIVKLQATPTGEAFVLEMDKLENNVPHAAFTATNQKEEQQPAHNKLEFVQFKRHALPKVAALEGEPRKASKEELLKEAKKFIP